MGRTPVVSNHYHTAPVPEVTQADLDALEERLTTPTYSVDWSLAILPNASLGHYMNPNISVEAFAVILELLESAAQWYDDHADNVRLATGADLKKVEAFRVEASAYRSHAVSLAYATGHSVMERGADDPDAIELITKGQLLHD